MSEHLLTTVAALKERFEGQEQEFRGEVSVILAPEQIVAACRALREEFDFELLVEETAVDYWPQEAPRFYVVYRIRSLKHNLILGLRVPLAGHAPSMPSIEGVYHNANWFERELWDMFGIHYEGHRICAVLLCLTIGKGTRCVKTIPWDTRKCSSALIIKKSTIVNHTPKSKAPGGLERLGQQVRDRECYDSNVEYHLNGRPLRGN